MEAVYNDRRDSAVSDNLLKPRSGALTDGASRAGARAMLRACGLQDDDFNKPLIGVANTWIEIGPCNYHLRELAHHVKEGIRAAGGTPLEFNTVSISDGITMGTEGMHTKQSASTRVAKWPTLSSSLSNGRLALGQALAAANSPPTPWHWSASFLGSHPWDCPAFPPPMPQKQTLVSALAKWFLTFFGA